MDTGNPWDSTTATSAAPPEVPAFAAFENADNNETKGAPDSPAWAAFGDAEMAPAVSADPSGVPAADPEVTAVAEIQASAEMVDETAA